MHSTNTGWVPAVLMYPSTQALADRRVALSTARAGASHSHSSFICSPLGIPLGSSIKGLWSNAENAQGVESFLQQGLKPWPWVCQQSVTLSCWCSLHFVVVTHLTVKYIWLMDPCQRAREYK